MPDRSLDAGPRGSALAQPPVATTSSPTLGMAATVRNDLPSAPVFFTICSKNFMAQALTLHESLVAAYGPVRFYLVLCDTSEGLDLLSFPFSIIEIDLLGISEWDAMCDRYSITELNTSVKPFAFEYIFDAHPGAEVVYLDPDILVVSRLDEVSELFAKGAHCVLTPHIAEPAEHAEFNDQKFLQFGVYNLGFCAMKDTPEVRRAVSWWGRRLLRDCLIDLPNGIFVDQKWADLLPAYIESTRILRHCGYNVAYWNLSQRRVFRGSDRWRSNDQELRFAHFSGSVIGSKTVFSRHSGTYNRSNVGDLALLLARFEERLFANGHRWFKKLRFGYKWNGASETNLHTPENSGVMPSEDDEDAVDRMPWLPVSTFTSSAQYRSAQVFDAGVLAARAALERSLLPQGEQTFKVPGTCALCGAETEFQVSFMFAPDREADGVRLPNWREHLDCEHCKLVNRVRASLHFFQQRFRPRPTDSIYLTEAVTRTFNWLSDRFEHVTGSEYLGPDHAPGALVNGVRNEDLQRLSFPSGSFEYILSFDVLEHVPDADGAFRELYRCLKPGGSVLFTAPFSVSAEENIVRAVMRSDSTIEHLLPPEYHGNPVDPDHGSLAFRAFGWEMLDTLRCVGFERAEAHIYWSRLLGYLGPHQLVFTATKPAGRPDTP